MKLSLRTRLIAVLILAVLVGTPGGLFAGCGAACPFGAALPCCHPSGPAPALRQASCCEAIDAAVAPTESSPAVRPLLPVFLAAAAPVSTASPYVAEPPTAELLLPRPPLLHEGIGLYTLHATFLI